MMRQQKIISYPIIESDKLDFLKSDLDCEVTEMKCFYHDTEWKSISLYKFDKDLQGILDSTVADIDQKDKVFIMPNCILPKFKIKEYIKKFKATLTDELDKATIIISDNTNSYELTTGYYEDIEFKSLTASFQGMTIEDKEQFIQKTGLNLDDNSIILAGSFHEQFDYHQRNSWGVEYTTTEFENYAYPYFLNILYFIKNKGIKVISSKDLHTKISEGFNLVDFETYDAVRSMLDSSDSSTRDLGVEFLCNSNYENADYNLWRLRHFYIENNRTNNLRFFLSESDWNNIRNLSTEGITSILYNKQILTKEILNELKPLLIQEFRDRTHYYTEFLEYDIKLPSYLQDILDKEEVIKEEVIEEIVQETQISEI